VLRPPLAALDGAIEVRWEAARERIALWLPVALGAGKVLQLALPATARRTGALLALSMACQRRAYRCGAARCGEGLLRDRASDHVRDLLSKVAGFDTLMAALAQFDLAEYNRDFCRCSQTIGAARRVVRASRGRDRIEEADMAAACAAADDPISDRCLPCSYARR
jgi:hypothetical protein